VLRAAQFHESVAQLVEWGRQGEVSYVAEMGTQLVAARTVAAGARRPGHRPQSAPAPGSSGAPIPEIAGPREESLVDMARLLTARRGDRVRIEGASDPARTATSSRRVPCCPARTPPSPARRSRIDSRPDVPQQLTVHGGPGSPTTGPAYRTTAPSAEAGGYAAGAAMTAPAARGGPWKLRR
jgi:hypothetical protein